MDQCSLEIFGLIADNLTQHDLVSLARASSVFASLVRPFLYHCVVYDSRYSQFDVDIDSRNQRDPKVATFIRTKANLVAFLNTVKQKPHVGRCVSQFAVVNVQDDFYDIEHFLSTIGDMPRDNLFTFFQLNKFRIAVPMGTRLLAQLAQSSSVCSRMTHLSYKFDRLTQLSDITFAENVTPNLEFLKFDNLYNITQFRQLCSFVSRNIKQLALRFKSDTPRSHHNGMLVLKSIHELPLTHLALSGLEFDMRYVQPLATDQLKYLELDDITVTDNDDSSDDSSVFLSNLCSSENLKSLEQLKLNISYPLMDFTFVCLVLSEIKLKKLDLVIRTNRIQHMDKLIDTYIDFITINRPSLVQLSIEIRDKNNAPIDELGLSQLSKLFSNVSQPWAKLKSLTLQTSFHFINTFKSEIFEKMPLLENLWILGPNCIPKHFGSGAAYPGIYDKWWRIIHLPRWFLDSKPPEHPLKYIKVDDCLFEIENANLNPKDLMDDTFDEMTKLNL